MRNKTCKNSGFGTLLGFRESSRLHFPSQPPHFPAVAGFGFQGNPRKLGKRFTGKLPLREKRNKTNKKKAEILKSQKMGSVPMERGFWQSREVRQEFGTPRKMELSRRSQKSLFRVNISPKFGQSMNKIWIWLLSFPESPDTLKTHISEVPPPLCETPSRGEKPWGFWGSLKIFYSFSSGWWGLNIQECEHPPAGTSPGSFSEGTK